MSKPVMWWGASQATSMMSAQPPAAAGAPSGSSLTGDAVPSPRAVTELRSLPPAARRPHSEHRQGSNRDDLPCPHKQAPGQAAADLLAFRRNIVGTEPRSQLDVPDIKLRFVWGLRA